MTKNLIERNRSREETSEMRQEDNSGSSVDASQQDLLHLPFILINAPRECKINCEMLEDRYYGLSLFFFEFIAC